MTDEPREQEAPDRATTRKAWVGERVAAAQALGERSLAWGTDRVPGADLGLEAFLRERHRGGALLAGGLAYRLFLWLLPLGLVVAALLSFWQQADPDGLDEAAERAGMGAAAVRSASQAIAESSGSRWYFLVLGLWFLVWFSGGVVRALRLAHALAWETPLEKLRRPVHAVLLFNAVVIGAMAISAFAAWLRSELGVAGVLVVAAQLVVYAAAALVVIDLLPHAADAPRRALLPGAVLLAVGTEAIHLFVVVYLAPRLGRSSALYGSLGAATVILLWLYVTARLIIGAAFLNATVWRRRQEQREPA